MLYVFTIADVLSRSTSDNFEGRKASSPLANDFAADALLADAYRGGTMVPSDKET